MLPGGVFPRAFCSLEVLFTADSLLSLASGRSSYLTLLVHLIGIRRATVWVAHSAGPGRIIGISGCGTAASWQQFRIRIVMNLTVWETQGRGILWYSFRSQLEFCPSCPGASFSLVLSRSLSLPCLDIWHRLSIGCHAFHSIFCALGVSE